MGAIFLQLSKSWLERRANDVMIGVLKANGCIHADVTTAVITPNRILFASTSQAMFTALDLLFGRVPTVQRFFCSWMLTMVAMIGQSQLEYLLMDQDQQFQLRAIAHRVECGSPQWQSAVHQQHRAGDLGA